MKNIARRIAIIIGAVALSAGLLGATAAPAFADEVSYRDSSWGR